MKFTKKLKLGVFSMGCATLVTSSIAIYSIATQKNLSNIENSKTRTFIKENAAGEDLILKGTVSGGDRNTTSIFNFDDTLRLYNYLNTLANNDVVRGDGLYSFLTSWSNTPDVVGWGYGTQLEFALHFTEGVPTPSTFDDRESIRTMLEGTNSHFWGDEHFSMSKFYVFLKNDVKINKSIKLGTNCSYQFLAHNKYRIWYQ